ncbi:MAG: immune inhibitor A, partial [Planctomycetes bacterium]|nr:immune inhibitor A [Planctomycetota bacterium]
MERSRVTDADGNYAFTGLAPGRFTVAQLVPADFVPVEALQADFDNGSGVPSADGFTTSGSAADQWHLSTGRDGDLGHSSGGSFYFGSGEGPAGGGLYSNNAFGTLTSPVIDLTGVGGRQVFLAFNHFLDAEDGFDIATVSVVSGGVVSDIADSDDPIFGGLGGLDFDTGGFVSERFDISAFAGQQVQIQFTFGSDNSVAEEGWYVDDVVVSVSRTVTLVSGQIVAGVDFANGGTGQISGNVFSDFDGNATQDAGEIALAGIPVFLDDDANGQRDAGEAFALTGANGNYVLDRLPAGNFIVAVDAAGYAITDPANLTHNVTLAVGGTATMRDFALQGGRIEGTKFLDVDGDGVRDAGEPGLAGFVIRALDATGNLVGQTVTDADGFYRLDVPGGDIVVVEDQQPGFLQTAPVAAGPGAVLFDFEAGTGGFAAAGAWHLSTGRTFNVGHSPLHSFYFGTGEGPNGGGTYANETFGTLTSPVINLPTGQAAFLEFNHFLSIEDFYDTASVTIIDGTTRTTIADNTLIGNLPDFTGRFLPVSLDVSTFAGRSIQVEFGFESDFSIVREGWYVDDVAIRLGAPGGAHVVVALDAGETRPGFDFGNQDLDEFPNAVVPGATPLAVAANTTTIVDSRIDRAGDVDVFRIVAPQTGFLAVRMVSPDFTLDPFLRQRDALGTVLDFDDDSGGGLDALLAFRVTAGQELFIEADLFPFLLDHGAYQLQVTSTGADLPVAFSSVGPDQFVGTATGQVANPGHVQVFRIDIPAATAPGSELVIDAARTPDSDLDTILILFDQFGNVVDFNDDIDFFGDNFNSRLPDPSFGVPIDVNPGDQFFAAVGGFADSSGRFSLTTRVAPPGADDFSDDVFAPFNLGSVPVVQNGRIGAAGEQDTFLISIPGGTSGVLEIGLAADAGSTLDTVLGLRDPLTGDLIAFNDDSVDPFGGFTLDSRITRQVLGGEQFVVVARGFSTSQGDYTLDVQLAGAIAGDVGNTIADATDLGVLDFNGLSVTRPGAIDSPFDVDVFRVEMSANLLANSTLRIQQNAAPGSSLDSFVRVFDAGGNLLAANDDVGFDPVTFNFSFNSLVSVGVQPGDVLFVQAGAFGSSTGGYELVLDVADDFANAMADAGDVPLDAFGSAVRAASLETRGDVDCFRPRFGGALANVAVAARRTGEAAALAGGVGDDPWGHWLRDRLAAEGVELRWFSLVPGVQTPLALVTFDRAREPAFRVHGEGIQATLASVEDRLEEAIGSASALAFGSNTLVN